jgi:hypothetical protein
MNSTSTIQGKINTLAPGWIKALAARYEPMDQRFQWLKCQNAQRQFLYLWRQGIHNRADYNSKHHPAKHHQAVRPFYIQDTHPRQ